MRLSVGAIRADLGRFDVCGRPGPSCRGALPAWLPPRPNPRDYACGLVRSSLRFFAWRFGRDADRWRVWSSHAIGCIRRRSKRRIAQPLRHSPWRCLWCAWRTGLGSCDLSPPGRSDQPAPLMGFCPSQLFSGRTVPLVSRFRGGCPRVVCAVPIIPISFRRGTGRRSKPDSNRTRTRLKPDSLTRLFAADFDCEGVRLLGVDPSVPAISSRRSIAAAVCAALGFASFGSTGHSKRCSVAGSSPHAFVGRRPIPLGRLSALELGWSRWPVFAEPRWSAANQAGLAPPALQRFQATDAWLLRSRCSREPIGPDEQPV